MSINDFDTGVISFIFKRSIKEFITIALLRTEHENQAPDFVV